MSFKQQWLGSILLLSLCIQASYAAPEPTQPCPSTALITKTFDSGATWKMCAELRAAEGLTLSQVYYAAPNKTARRVLGEASLSQLEILSDSATTPTYVLTQQGLGNKMLALSSADCPNGTIKTLALVNGVCRITQEYGYQYKYENQRQGSFFELSTRYDLHPLSLNLRWRFYENGMIEPALGLSGQLVKNSNKIIDNFTSHAAWRLDFDLGNTGNDDQILEVTSTPSEDRLTKMVNISVLGKEAGRLEDPEIKRSWIVRDGTTPYEGISVPAYDIIPSHYNYSRINPFNEPWLQQDIYFSKYNVCERHAADNPIDDCPKRADSVTRYVANKEIIDSADSVVWYRQSYHHIARSDDNSKLGTIWSSFQLVPRDWHSQNPF